MGFLGILLLTLLGVLAFHVVCVRAGAKGFIFLCCLYVFGFVVCRDAHRATNGLASPEDYGFGGERGRQRILLHYNIDPKTIPDDAKQQFDIDSRCCTEWTRLYKNIDDLESTDEYKNMTEYESSYDYLKSREEYNLAKQKWCTVTTDGEWYDFVSNHLVLKEWTVLWSKAKVRDYYQEMQKYKNLLSVRDRKKIYGE